MDFHPNDYVLGVWFAQKFNSGDVIICVKKKPQGWQIEYLIRVIEDGKITSKTNRRLMLSPIETEDETKSRIDKVFLTLKRMYPDFGQYVDIRGDYHALLFKLAMTDWVHFDHDNSDLGDIKRDVRTNS